MIYKSPGKGLQTYRVLGEDSTSVAVEITGHSGHKLVTCFEKNRFYRMVEVTNEHS